MGGDQKFNLWMHILVYLISIVICWKILPDYNLIIIISIWYLVNFIIHFVLFLYHKRLTSQFKKEYKDFFFSEDIPEFDQVEKIQVICSFGLSTPFLGGKLSWMGDYFYLFIVTKNGTTKIISSEFSEDLNTILLSKTKKNEFYPRLIALAPKGLRPNTQSFKKK